MTNPSLDDLRLKLDVIDDQIVELLGKRFEVIAQVKEVKRILGTATYQQEREKEILKRVVAHGKELGLNSLLLQALFLQIFAVSKREQV
ncbi:MAG: chorismate mutase [Candidatus Peregrinibacteria bacterium]|nr:chorismate mutase [Candidatus Peregrinibacteria bacterium]